jgi:prepilin-type N-terminal cleavage/methylation domain-containing protein
MKKSKKKLKGMTLIEMIISIFIFAIMGGLLILIGTHIDATSKAANNLKNKVVVESPYAANHYKTIGVGEDGKDIDLPSQDMDIKVKIKESGTYWTYELTDESDPTSWDYVEHSYGDAGYVEVDMKARKYQTETLVTDGMTTEQINDMRKRSNGKLNLDFFDVLPAEEPEEATP